MGRRHCPGATIHSKMNPYEADPARVPPDDRYAADPGYGRYLPSPDDFVPDQTHVASTSPESIEYWAAVLGLCLPSNRIYEDAEGGRDVFALGTLIVKSSHLHPLPGRRSSRDYAYPDCNELAATALARQCLDGIRVPHIYFRGQINGRNVLVQERLPGVGLNVAWEYLGEADKASFKEQARDIIRQMARVQPPFRDASSDYEAPTYVTPDADPILHRGIQAEERNTLFAPAAPGELIFAHNDFTTSNIIVDAGKITGLIDWEMSGWFTFRAVRDIHRRIRSPQRQSFSALKLPEDFLCDVLSWNDIYDFELHSVAE